MAVLMGLDVSLRVGLLNKCLGMAVVHEQGLRVWCLLRNPQRVRWWRFAQWLVCKRGE